MSREDEVPWDSTQPWWLLDRPCTWRNSLTRDTGLRGPVLKVRISRQCAFRVSAWEPSPCSLHILAIFKFVFGDTDNAQCGLSVFFGMRCDRTQKLIFGFAMLSQRHVPAGISWSLDSWSFTVSPRRNLWWSCQHERVQSTWFWLRHVLEDAKPKWVQRLEVAEGCCGRGKECTHGVFKASTPFCDSAYGKSFD